MSDDMFFDDEMGYTADDSSLYGMDDSSLYDYGMGDVFSQLFPIEPGVPVVPEPPETLEEPDEPQVEVQYEDRPEDLTPEAIHQILIQGLEDDWGPSFDWGPSGTDFTHFTPDADIFGTWGTD